MTQYTVLDEVYVPFKPAGLVADMDLSKAVQELNKNSDYVVGTMGKEVDQATQPAFKVTSFYDDLIRIEIYDTESGKALNKLLDDATPVRFGCTVLFVDETDAPTSFGRFFADVQKEELIEVKSDVLALPGVDFDVDKVLEN